MLVAPKVSVIMAAYNAGRFIGESIESVLSQTFDDFELIIVDDGSVDDTASIVQRYASKDPRIRYLWQTNSGQSAARNVGLAAAAGRYISLIDADDLWHPGKLARQIDLVDDEDDVFVLTGNQRFSDNAVGERVFGSRSMPPAATAERLSVAAILGVDLMQMVLINTALAPRVALQQLGGWNAKLHTAEDWELWARAGVGWRFRMIDEPLVLYRKHEGSITASEDFSASIAIRDRIVRAHYQAKQISRGEMVQVRTKRYLEACGVFIHRSEFRNAFLILARIAGMPGGMLQRATWSRAAEVVRLGLSVCLRRST